MITQIRYIGSTTQPLNKRIGQHRSDYKQYQEGNPKFTTSFEIIKLGNYYIEIFECNNKEELFAKERQYIELHKDICVNKFIPNRTDKEYKEDNREKIKEYQIEYREINKEKIKEYHKENYENNKEKLTEIFNCCCGASIQKCEIARHKKTMKHIRFIESQTTTNIS